MMTATLSPAITRGKVRKTSTIPVCSALNSHTLSPKTSVTVPNVSPTRIGSPKLNGWLKKAAPGHGIADLHMTRSGTIVFNDVSYVVARLRTVDHFQPTHDVQTACDICFDAVSIAGRRTMVLRINRWYVGVTGDRHRTAFQIGGRPPDDWQVERSSHLSLRFQHIQLRVQHIAGHGLYGQFGSTGMQVDKIVSRANEFS